MPSLGDVADRAFADPEDAYVVLVALFGDGAELDPDDLPDPIADDVAAILGADLRALAYPPHSPGGDLALYYRETGDRAALDELRARGHTEIVASLEFERPRPDDPASVAGTRRIMREHVDRWIAAAPADPYRGPTTYRLGSH